MSKWIRIGDTVVVIAGNDKGKKGKVLRLGKTKVVVQGVNIRAKHMKAESEQKGAQIIRTEMPIHISNVMLAPAGNPVKVRVKIDEKTKEKLLVYRENGNEVLHRKVKKHVVG